MLKRSIWKYNYVHQDLFRVNFLKHQNTVFRTKARSSVILPFLLNLNIGVYDGFTFFKLNLSSNMVGYKLGEFIKTRQPFRFGKK